MVVINKEPEESATNLKKTVNVLTVIDVDSHMVMMIPEPKLKDQREFASNSKKEIVLMEINVDFLMKIKSKMLKQMINKKNNTKKKLLRMFKPNDLFDLLKTIFYQ